MFRLLFELNRRMPNGTYGGVRGIINLYSICFAWGRLELPSFEGGPYVRYDNKKIIAEGASAENDRYLIIVFDDPAAALQVAI